MSSKNFVSYGDSETLFTGIKTALQPRKKTWEGTQAEWDALPLADKIKFERADITDDDESGDVDSVPTENSQNLVTSGGVYSALSTKADSADLGTAAGKNYTTNVSPNNHDLVESNAVYSAINNALSSVYTPRGSITCAELVSSLLIPANVGNVYNTTDSGTTTADFMQGAGVTINAGDSVGIIQTGPSIYKFNLMGNTIDLHEYQKKDLAQAVESATTVEGALGALSTNKADKVSSAINGNFAGLDASGNLTDSGKKPSDFQTVLTFDNAPTENSNNPVKSGGVYSADANIYQVMGQNSAKNFIPFDLDRIKAKNTTGTWNGNVYSVNGIDFTFNSDGTVDASGTATETAAVHYYDPIGLPPFGGDRILRLTGCPSGGSGTTYKVMAYRAGAVDGSTGTAEDYGDGISLRWLNDGSGVKAFVSISVYTGAGTIDLTFKPMLRLSTDTDNTFAPYAKTNQELTAETQVLTNQVNVYGSKNVLDLTPRLKKQIPTSSAIVSFSNEGIVLNGTVSSSGNIRICPAEDDNSFVLPQGTYVLSHKDGSTPSGTGITLRKNGTVLTNNNRLTNPYEFEANGTDYFTVLFHESATTFNNAVVCPMICLKSIYDLDNTYEPYAKTNQQLTEDTTALLDNMMENGAVNMLPIDLNYIKANNSASSWSGNACTHNGVTYTIDEANGKITVNGTASERSTLQVYNAIAGDLFKKGFKYLAKVFNNNFNTVNGYYVQLYMTNSPYTRIDAFTGNNFVVPDSFFDNSIRVSIQIVVENGKSVDNQVITPLIAFGNYTGGFEKYAKSNKELTEELKVTTGQIARLVSFSSISAYYARKYGKVVELYFAGTLSEAVNNWTDFLTVPDGFRPSHYVQIVSFNTYNGCKNLQLAPSGGIQSAYNLVAGDFIRFTVTYIIN